jgi:DNA-binding NarL/FixJ family response regulator
VNQERVFEIVFVGDPNAASDPDRRIARLYGLTTAETRLLGALFAGQRLKDYAAASSISVNTAKFHLKNIFAKLKVNDRNAAMNVAIKRGIVQIK